MTRAQKRQIEAAETRAEKNHTNYMTAKAQRDRALIVLSIAGFNEALNGAPHSTFPNDLRHLAGIANDIDVAKARKIIAERAEEQKATLENEREAGRQYMELRLREEVAGAEAVTRHETLELVLEALGIDAYSMIGGQYSTKKRAWTPDTQYDTDRFRDDLLTARHSLREEKLAADRKATTEKVAGLTKRAEGGYTGRRAYEPAGIVHRGSAIVPGVYSGAPGSSYGSSDLPGAEGSPEAKVAAGETVHCEADVKAMGTENLSNISYGAAQTLDYPEPRTVRLSDADRALLEKIAKDTRITLDPRGIKNAFDEAAEDAKLANATKIPARRKPAAKKAGKNVVRGEK